MSRASQSVSKRWRKGGVSRNRRSGRSGQVVSKQEQGKDQKQEERTPVGFMIMEQEEKTSGAI